MENETGEQDVLPDVREWTSDGGEHAQAAQSTTAAEREHSQGAVTQPRWTEEEWRRWNQWHGGWSRSWNYSTTWESQDSHEAETTEARGTSVNPAPVAALDSRGLDPLQAADPWSRTWQTSWNQSKKDDWWGSTKGDYSEPPIWAGWQHYRLWRRALTRWNGNTDVALHRRAEKVLKNMEWELQAKLEHITEEELASHDYLSAILGVLDVLAGERQDSEKRRSIRAALYEGNRHQGESLAQYSLRRESQFASASRYMSLPDELRAFMLEEQAGLSKQGIQNLRVLTEGKHEYGRVKKALQVLDTEEESLFKSTKASYLTAEPLGDGQDAESGSDSESCSLDEESFLAIAEKDLTEDEAMNFLMQNAFRRRTWSENKQLKAARKKDRRHFDDKQSRPTKPQGHRHLPIAELKKITRCSNCGEKGHWKEDCVKPYRSKSSREKTEKSSGNAFVFMGSSSSSSFCVLAESGLEVFLTLPPGHAIIDPGASQDLIGLKSFERLTESLGHNGLKPIKLDEVPAPASGIGGDARPLFCALSPCVLGGKPGIIKLTVVSDDVPQLLSVGLLEHAGAIIDVPRNQIRFQNFGTSADMNRLSSGHRTLDISSWNGEPFPVPQQLRDQFQLSADASNLADAQVSRDYAAFSCHEHAVELSVHEVMRYARKGQNDSESIVVPFGLIICCDVNSFSINDPFASHQYHQPTDVKYCTSWLIESKQKTCALLEMSREIRKKASDQVRKHIMHCLESKDNSSESYVVCLLSFSPVILLTTDNVALSSEASRTQASYQSSCSELVSDVSSVHARGPAREGSIGVVRHDEAASDATEGANQPGSSIGISTDAVVRRGCDNSGTTAQGVPSSSGSHGQGRQSTWLLEDMWPLQQANDLQEVGTKQSSSESTRDQEAQERHRADLCEHWASSSDPALSTSAELRRAHHNARRASLDHAADGSAGSVDCRHGLAGDGPYDGDNAADGSQSSATSDYGSGSATADRAPPSAAGRSDATSNSRISSSSGDSLGRGADGSSCWRPVGDASQLSSGIRSFTNSRFHGSEVKCTDDPSWFIGRLNMAVVNYFLSHDQPCFWGIGNVCDAVGCVFYSPDLCRELCFGDCSEHRELQVPRKVKRSIQQSSEKSSSSKFLHEQFAAFCHKASQLMDGNSSGSSDDESESKATAQTDSHAAKARTARKDPNGDEQIASRAAKARTARKDPNGDGQIASHAAKARTARKDDQDQKQINSHDHETAAISNISPGRLSSNSPSPCWLSSVGSQFGMEGDERLQRFRKCLNDKKTYKILELFSPPRITERARQVGFSTTSPAAFDMKTGWNVLDAKDRAEFWRVVHDQKPDCILMTPDCRPFSSMMQSNWSRMTEPEVQRIQQEGLIMWHFCVQVAEHQISQNKEFCIEQPGFASSAQTHATKWLLQQPGVIRFLFDQCMTGLKVKGDELSRKTTALTTNHLGLAAVFSSLQCPGDHSHVPLEGGLPAKAAIFGAQLIENFIRGLSFRPELSFYGDDEEEEGDLENALDAEIEASGAREPPARRAHQESAERLTSEQKKKVNQVHLNLGHLSREQMLSLFKAAGAKEAVMRYLKEEYSCEHCMRQRRPIDRKKATMQRTFAFNRQVGIDTFYISWGGRTHAYLNVVCQGTNYQQVCWLQDYDGGAPSSKVAWQAFCQCWLKPFGLPEMVISDGGPEFKDIFERSLEQLNILQLVCDAASPWQNGRVERHGG